MGRCAAATYRRSARRIITFDFYEDDGSIVGDAPLREEATRRGPRYGRRRRRKPTRIPREIFMKIHHYIRSLEWEPVGGAPLFSTALKKERNERRKKSNSHARSACPVFLSSSLSVTAVSYYVVSSLARRARFVEPVYEKRASISGIIINIWAQ